MNKKTKQTLSTICLIVVILLADISGIDLPISVVDVLYGTATPQKSCQTLNLQEHQKVEDVAIKARIERVVDGDTLIVIEEGQKKRVRLIGVDTPESVHPNNQKNTKEGVLASEYTKNLLSSYRVVWLVKDRSDTDRYNRELRYVWLDKDADVSNYEDVKSKMLNGILLDSGVARQKEYKPDVAYTKMFQLIAQNS